MKNVEMKLEENILTIKVDLTKEFGPSASGKTTIIASTEGNISVPDKDDIKIGLNIYKKK
jgi:ABC-type molybdate transport system ATPase subunit